MRRADRLFQVIQALRRRPVVTASQLARELEVSERTVYRDIADLVASGVPIEGAAGVGYMLRKGFELPPLMFRPDEIEALTFGARVVASFADPELARAARDALARLEAALPAHLRERIERSPLHAPGFHVDTAASAWLPRIRDGIDNRRRTHIAYTDAAGRATERVVWPLGLFFWGRSWSMTAWCELRDDFRDFRLDRISALTFPGDRFPEVPGRTLEDWLARVRQESGGEWP